MADKAVKDISKRAAMRSGEQHPLKVSINRLRGRHGATLFGGILQKIDRSDILFFDISGGNPNVHFELGYAIAKKGSDLGRVYVFSEEVVGKSKKPCSDLACYMLTKYTFPKNKGKSKSYQNDRTIPELKDQRGFHAALVNTLIDIARERGMWGTSKTIFEKECDF